MKKYRLDITALLVIVGAGLILSIPLLVRGFPGMADDGAVHGIWSANFLEQWRQGAWYPHWLTSMNHGRGSPVFFYHYPLPFWVMSWLSFGLVEDYLPWLAMGRSVTLALLLSGVTCYVWLRANSTPRAALCGSLFYMFLPYHLAIDLYARGAFGEFWAFAWLPLIFYFLGIIFKSNGKGEWGFSVCGLAMSYCLLILSHLPTTLILTPVILAYCVWGVESTGRQRLLAVVNTAFGLGIGASLAAVNLMPAMLFQEFVGVGGLGNQINPYSNYFLTLGNALTPRDFLIATLTTVTLALGCSLASYKYSPENGSRIRFFWMGVALVSIFMMISPSRIIWMNLRILQTIQFPWRFNVLLVMASVALCTRTFADLRSWKLPVQRTILALTTCCILVTFVLLGQRIKKDYITRDPSAIEAVSHISLRRICDPPEYRTIWARNSVDKLEPTITIGQLKFPPRAHLSGAGKVSLRSTSPREFLFEVHSGQAQQLTIEQFYFPGWQCKMGGNTASDHAAFESLNNLLSITPTKPDGFMMVSVPAGDFIVGLQLTVTPVERLGREISLIALMLTFAIGAFSSVRMLRLREVRVPRG